MDSKFQNMNDNDKLITCYICLRAISKSLYDIHFAKCKQINGEKYKKVNPEIRQKEAPKKQAFNVCNYCGVKQPASNHNCQKKNKPSDKGMEFEDVPEKKPKQDQFIHKCQCPHCDKLLSPSKKEKHKKQCQQKMKRMNEVS